MTSGSLFTQVRDPSFIMPCALQTGC